MKYKQLFFTMICLSVTTLFNAMNNLSNLKGTEEITLVKDPWCAKYITNNSIVISGANGCALVNTKTKEANNIGDVYNYARNVILVPLLQNNAERIIVSYNKIATIYNTQTGLEEGSIGGKKTIRSLAYDSNSNTIFLSYGEKEGGVITKYNFSTKDKTETSIDCQCCQSISMHPKKQILCIADRCANIFLYKSDTLKEIKKIIVEDGNSIFDFCQYSSDGSRIVAGNSKKLFIINPDIVPLVDSCLQAKKHEYYQRIAFHPNNSTLAILSSIGSYKPSLGYVYVEQIVRYWDIKTQKFIDEESALDSEYGYDLSFSPNGLEIIIVLEGKCIRMPVSFAIKEKYIYISFLLHQIAKQENLIKDIVHYCSNILLKTFTL
ncbi:MAG TPA: WD40 repeat domain-containing protein [Candidatus Babeliales bacterium]|nr:WD40 repeat domain-containing protein [Candidatus Babeliales bacterium]